MANICNAGVRGERQEVGRWVGKRSPIHYVEVMSEKRANSLQANDCSPCNLHFNSPLSKEDIA